MIMQYLSYGLWATLIVILIYITNRKVKQRKAAKQAKLNPSVNLYPFELVEAKGEITIFFSADDAMDYEFFVESAIDSVRVYQSKGVCRPGGQKIKFDTTTVENGQYFYGIQTPFQRVEKKIVIRN